MMKKVLLAKCRAWAHDGATWLSTEDVVLAMFYFTGDLRML